MRFVDEDHIGVDMRDERQVSVATVARLHRELAVAQQELDRGLRFGVAEEDDSR